MDFETNMNNMFGSDKVQEHEAIANANESINEVDKIKLFFESSAGKLFISWFNEVRIDLTEKLEDCSDKDLIKLQANVRAVKLLTTILSEKIEELDDLKDRVKQFAR